MLTTVELFKLAQEEIMPFLFSFYDEDTRVSTSLTLNTASLKERFLLLIAFICVVA